MSAIFETVVSQAAAQASIAGRMRFFLFTPWTGIKRDCGGETQSVVLFQLHRSALYSNLHILLNI